MELGACRNNGLRWSRSVSFFLGPSALTAFKADPKSLSAISSSLLKQRTALVRALYNATRFDIVVKINVQHSEEDRQREKRSHPFQLLGPSYYTNTRIFCIYMGLCLTLPFLS
jgi:hypothetical protein